jgi:hypothetical protein
MPKVKRKPTRALNPESLDAYEAVKPSVREKHQAILELLALRPMTSKELEGGFGLHHQRTSELLAEGRIERSGQRRSRCAVLRLKETA